MTVKKPIPVLLVEDSPEDAHLIQHILGRSQPEAFFRVQAVDRLSAALEALRRASFELVLLDLHLPDSVGLDTLLRLQAEVPDVPIVLLTGLDDEEMAMEALSLGAQDYLPKTGISGSWLARSMRYAIERKRAQLARRQSEERFRKVFDEGPTGMALLDSDQRITEVNAALGRMLGYSRGELKERRLSEFAVVAGDDHDPEDRLFNELIEGHRDSYTLIQRYRRKDGSLAWGHLAVSLLHGQTGAPDHAIAMVQDITELREAEAKLRAQETLAQLGQMAALVAHEVKNALAGIGGVLQVLKSRLPSDSPDFSITDEVQRRLALLNSMIENLLLVARPIEPRHSTHSLQRILRETARFLLHDTGMKDIEVEIADSDLTIEADAELLKLLFHNLYKNAAEAMHGEGVIRVDIGEQDDRCVVSVLDSGPGLPPELRNREARPFFTTKTRGTGLGLTLARRVTEAHGGELRFSSPAGGGTLVEVHLPRLAPVVEAT